ncbi:hypothetical protein ABIC75_003549 [Dyella japonica]|uniref:Uncharacterized protein n=1 Tax=Dyella japonica TaxID=231455 RepID=A0ABV2JYA8_9GAMM
MRGLLSFGRLSRSNCAVIRRCDRSQCRQVHEHLSQFVIPANPRGGESRRCFSTAEGWSSSDFALGYRESVARSYAAISPACRLRSGRFDRLPPLESLFFCWPKRKVTQRKWPLELAASCWDKPERLRMVVAGHPWEAIQRILRSAAQRARIAEDLKRGPASRRPLLWLRSSRSYAMHRISPSPLVGEGWGEGAGAREIVATRALVVTLRGPRMTTAGGWRKARRVAAGMRPVFRQDTDVLSKNPVTRPRT